MNNNPSTYNGRQIIMEKEEEEGGELADEEYLQQPMSFAGAATPPNVAKIIAHTSHAQTSSQHLAWIPLDSSCMRTFAKHPPPIVRRSKLAKTRFCEK